MPTHFKLCRPYFILTPPILKKIYGVTAGKPDSPDSQIWSVLKLTAAKVSIIPKITFFGFLYDWPFPTLYNYPGFFLK